MAGQCGCFVSFGCCFVAVLFSFYPIYFHKEFVFLGFVQDMFFSIMKAVPLLYYCSDVCFLTCFVLHRKDVSLRHFDSEATCYNRHYGYIQIFHFYIYDELKSLGGSILDTSQGIYVNVCSVLNKHIITMKCSTIK